MNNINLLGLEGTNPLHVLASFGALAVTTELDSAHAALGWSLREGRYVPRLSTEKSPAEWCKEVAHWVQERGRVVASATGGTLARELREAKAREKGVRERLKSLRATLKKEAKELALKGPSAKAHGAARLADTQREVEAAAAARLELECRRANELGYGYAHLGDIIGVPVTVFRDHLRAAGLAQRSDDDAPGPAEDAGLLRHLAGLASDGAHDDGGVLLPTPFSFGNGASGQCLLKDWRNLTALSTPELIAASLVAGERHVADVTSLNWDPGDQRSAALQWQDPQSMPKETDVIANVLAYLGLGVVTSVPTLAGLEAVAFERGFTWPLWEPQLPLPLVAALVATDVAADSAPQRQARGVLAVFRSERINPTGKRNYFAPAMPV